MIHVIMNLKEGHIVVLHSYTAKRSNRSFAHTDENKYLGEALSQDRQLQSGRRETEAQVGKGRVS